MPDQQGTASLNLTKEEADLLLALIRTSTYQNATTHRLAAELHVKLELLRQSQDGHVLRVPSDHPSEHPSDVPH